MLLIFNAFKFFLKVETHWDQIESMISKIIHLFRLPKISVAYSVTTVKDVFAIFLNFCKKIKINVLISISLFCQNIDF